MTKQGVILCPGPSVVGFVPTVGKTIIGVNRVVRDYRLDWWVVGDPKTIENGRQWIRSGQSPNVFLKPGVDGGALTESTILSWKSEAIKKRYTTPDGGEMVNRSVLAAIVLAVNMGLEVVEMYGADMNGEAYYDGQPLTELMDTTKTPDECVSRLNDRWLRERQYVAELIDWADTHGCKVQRNREEIMI